MVFDQLKILIISPERWGINKLSKHHYAIELASRNNQVYFLNPPQGVDKFSVEESEYKNVFIVDFPNQFSGLNRLHSILFLFKFLQQRQVSQLKKYLNVDFDVVWSFDPFRFQLLKLFDARFTIFHPVDFFKTSVDTIAARQADLVLSVAKDILEKYIPFNKNCFFLNHGVSSSFLDHHAPVAQPHSKIQCGYVGNLLSFGIHHENLNTIVEQNPDVHFHFIGPQASSNLGTFKNSHNTIERLSKLQNVTMHGSLPVNKVAEMIQGYDLFLVCYDPEKVPPVGANNHKILEYLSTGHVVVSSRTTAYDTLANGLFEMVQESSKLPDLFKKVVGNIAQYNSAELQQKRKAFASSNRYENHVQSVGELITKHVEKN